MYFWSLLKYCYCAMLCTSNEPVWGSVLTQSPDKAEKSGGKVWDSHHLLWPQGGMKKGTLKGNIRWIKCLLLPVEWNWIAWVLVSLYKYLLRKKKILASHITSSWQVIHFIKYISVLKKDMVMLNILWEWKKKAHHKWKFLPMLTDQETF